MHRISEPQTVDAFTLSRASPWLGRGTGTVRSSTLLLPGRNAARMLCSMFFIINDESKRAGSFSNHGGVISPFMSQRSCHDCPSFHRNTWPLISRQLRSMVPMASISSSVNGSLTTPSRLLKMWSRSVENGVLVRAEPPTSHRQLPDALPSDGQLRRSHGPGLVQCLQVCDRARAVLVTRSDNIPRRRYRWFARTRRVPAAGNEGVVPSHSQRA